MLRAELCKWQGVLDAGAPQQHSLAAALERAHAPHEPDADLLAPLAAALFQVGQGQGLCLNTSAQACRPAPCRQCTCAAVLEYPRFASPKCVAVHAF